MPTPKRNDLILAATAGFLSAAVWAAVLARLIKDHATEISLLFLAIPLAFIAVLYAGAALARWKRFFSSFAKFAMIGILNSGIDFAVFNLLIYATGIERGAEIVAFKAASFAVALVNSFFWNKFWVFEAGRSEGRHREFFSYAGVTAIGLALNVGAASLIVNFIAPRFGLSQVQWDNLAAVLAVAASLAWNYFGYRTVVFKKSSLALKHGF